MTLAARLIDIVVRLARIGTGLAFAILIVSVLIQVIGRTAGSSPVWTEELTRFALLYLVAFGTGLSLRSGDLVNVDVVCEYLPGNWPWRLRLFASVVTGALALFLLPPAWKYVSIGWMQTSPALTMPMAYVHFTVFLLLALLLVFSALRVIGMLTGTEDGRPTKEDEV